MRLVIDTTGMTFTVGSDFEPVLDFETKQPKADRQTGAMLAQVQVIAFYTDDRGKPRSEIITVKLPDPTPVPAGTPVRLVGLAGHGLTCGRRVDGRAEACGGGAAWS